MEATRNQCENEKKFYKVLGLFEDSYDLMAHGLKTLASSKIRPSDLKNIISDIRFVRIKNSQKHHKEENFSKIKNEIDIILELQEQDFDFKRWNSTTRHELSIDEDSIFLSENEMLQMEQEIKDRLSIIGLDERQLRSVLFIELKMKEFYEDKAIKAQREADFQKKQREHIFKKYMSTFGVVVRRNKQIKRQREEKGLW